MIVPQLTDNHFDGTFQINADINSNQTSSFPTIASLTHGGFIVTWESAGQDASGFDIFGQLFDENSNPVGTEFQVNTYIDSDQTYPSVTALKNGDFVIVWASENQVDVESQIGGIYGQRFDSLGNPIADEFLIYASSYYSPYGSIYPDDRTNYRTIHTPIIAELSNTDLVAVIHETTRYALSPEGLQTDIKGVIFDGESNSIIDEFELGFSNYRNNSTSFVVLGNENLVVGWDSRGRYYPANTYIDIFNNGSSILENKLRIDGLMYEIDDLDERNPSIVSLNDGNFFVTWETSQVEPISPDYPSVDPSDRLLDADIYGQFFTENGIPINKPIQINGNFYSDLTSLNQTLPSVTKLNDNQLVIVWQSEEQDSSKSGIYGQRLDYDSNLIGVELKIDPFQDSFQDNPTITTLNDGNVMVIWESKGEDGFVNSINGQILSSDMFDLLLTTPIYRFQNTQQSGTYLFVGEEERQSIIASYPNFTEEGEAFKVAIAPDDDLIVINRFQNKDIPGTYLYAGEEESINIRANYSNFKEEGVAFYVYDANAGKGVDFYRFQNTQIPGTYIFVGEEERQNIIANYPNFIEEGVAFEVLV